MWNIKKDELRRHVVTRGVVVWQEETLLPG